MAALVCLVDIGDPAVLGAAQAGLQRFGASLCLQAPPPPAAGAGEPALGARHGQPIVGLTNLAKPPQAAKPVLQVRCRPGPFVLRDFHAAVSRLQASGGATGGVTGAIAAAVLQQLVGLVAADAACAAAGGQPTVLHLTDRTDYDPDDFRTCLEVLGN